MTAPDLKDQNKVSLAQAIGFAITIVLFMITGWVNLNSRVAVIEAQQKDIDNAMIILSSMKSEITEVKTSLRYIEMKLREDEKR